jgi:hypothetical protein
VTAHGLHRRMHERLTNVLPDWTADGACSGPGVDTRCFFPDKGDDVHAFARQAKAICATCPIDHGICREYGDRVSPSFGTYGSLTAAERRQRRMTGRAA